MTRNGDWGWDRRRMKHETVTQLYRYWDQLRKNRPAPYRSELDPRAISSLLESTFVLEHRGPLDIRFRLAGTKLCDQFGMELRGMSALAFWHGDGRDRVRKMIGRVVEEPVVSHVAATIETREGYLYDAEFLYMPLLSDFGEVNRILGCGCYHAGDGVAARRLDPLHHWVDRVSFYQIAATEPATARKVSVGENSVLNETLAAITKDKLYSAAPTLRSIKGGAPALQRLSADKSEGSGGRSHLRVVKRDD